MAISVQQNLAMAEKQQQQQPLPIRRAVYVHVSDLTSAYDIDNDKLEAELAKAKAARERASRASTHPEEELHLFDQGPTTDVDGTVSTVPQKRLQPPRGGYNLCVLVGNVNVVVDKLRVDRSRVRLAEVEIGDETGVVSLRARDDQIEILKEISERSGAVVLRNATIELYQGRHIRLAVTKWGKISRYPDQIPSTPPPPTKINQDRNFSLIDLSSVATEMVIPPPDTSQVRPSSERDEGRGPVSSPRIQQPQGGVPQHQQHGGHRGGGSNRDRRQRQRQHKPGGLMQPPAPQVARFPPLQGFPPNYGETLEVQTHYAYPSAPSQHGSQQTSAQQAQQMLIQQIEHQQRQFQQMQMYQEQQERHRRIIGQHQQQQQGRQIQASPVLLPGMVGPAGSFESQGGDYNVSASTGATDQFQSVLPVVGSNPVLIPVSMAVPSQMGGHPAHQASLGSSEHSHQEAYNVSTGLRSADMQQAERTGSPKISSSEVSSGTAWARGPPVGLHQPRADSPGSPGRMNPQATAFAPSYVQQQSPRHLAEYAYVTFDPSQGTRTIYSASPPQHPVYAQQVMYVPAAHTVEHQNQPGRIPASESGLQQGGSQHETAAEAQKQAPSTHGASTE